MRRKGRYVFRSGAHARMTASERLIFYSSSPRRSTPPSSLQQPTRTISRPTSHRLERFPSPKLEPLLGIMGSLHLLLREGLGVAGRPASPIPSHPIWPPQLPIVANSAHLLHHLRSCAGALISRNPRKLTGPMSMTKAARLPLVP